MQHDHMISDMSIYPIHCIPFWSKSDGGRDDGIDNSGDHDSHDDPDESKHGWPWGWYLLGWDDGHDRDDRHD